MQARLIELEEEHSRDAELALTEFEASFHLNMEDVSLLEGLRTLQGAATTEVRILLSQLSMQQADIDERISSLRAMLPSAATRGSGEASGEEEPLATRLLQVGGMEHGCPYEPCYVRHIPLRWKVLMEYCSIFAEC